MVKTNLFKFICRILCNFGCIFHSFKISELYFSYETTTNVKYEDEKQIDVPGITICVNKLTELLNETHKMIYTDKAILLEQEKFINNMSIEQQFSMLNDS